MIRLNKSERQLVQAAAVQTAQPPAGWARQALLRAATQASTNARNPQHVSDRPQLVSFFCGPGGLDQGFHDAGFTTRAAFDIDAECVRTFNHNHSNQHPVAHREDLRDIDVERVFAVAGDSFAPVGVLGGPPCQSFSVSNVFQTDDDPRHDLPLTYARLLRRINERHPLSFFLFENVPGLLGPRHKEKFLRFKEQFEAAGFELFDSVLDAWHYGVAQVRARVFIMGINRAKHPAARWVWPEPEPECNRRTVRQTIGHLPEPARTGRNVTAEYHCNHWCMVPRSKKFETEGALSEGQAWGRSFRTLSWDEPSWTVAYGNREIHVHPSGKRRLSIYEAMLLQSFPPDYELTGNISAQCRLVSEAVPPRLGWHLAVAIRRCLGL